MHAGRWVLVVAQSTDFSGRTSTLNPPRDKVVLISPKVNVPVGAVVGRTVRVTGTNHGVGKPLTARRIVFVQDGEVHLPRETQKPADFPGTVDQFRAFKAFNDLRIAAGLRPCRWDNRLMRAAQSHVDYMRENNKVSHDEEPNLPGFTGRTPEDRTRATGYSNRALEILVGYIGKDASPEKRIHLMFLVPYHRAPILNFAATEIGIGIRDYILGVNVGLNKEVGTVVWPHDGQTNVPCIGSATEIPSPLRVHGIPPERTPPVGYVVTFFHQGSTIRVKGATLTTEMGQPVDCWINTPDNDFINGVIFIPKRPFSPGIRIWATVDATDEQGNNLSRRWSFRTTAI
jgi:uncharacterized protein YkwD